MNILNLQSCITLYTPVKTKRKQKPAYLQGEYKKKEERKKAKERKKERENSHDKQRSIKSCMHVVCILHIYI